MKKNWKTSFGKCIYRNDNQLNIYDNYFYRWLTFASPYIQTMISKSKSHIPQLPYMQPLTIAARQEIGPTCIFGLGGGAIVHYLNKYKIDLTVIEKNSLVIDLAQRYFYLNNINNLEIICADANQYAAENYNRFTHLLIDIHTAFSFPTQCLNMNFFIHCKKCLLENGVLAINICNASDLQPIYNFVAELFTNKIITIPINKYTNTILLASDKFSTEYVITQFASHPEIKKVAWDSTYGYITEL